MVLPLVADHSLVERVGDDALDLVGDKPLATDELFPSPTSLDDTLAGSQSLGV